MLESQVGTNPRVRVQQDAAFVLWDQIDFADDEPTPASSPSTPTPVPTSPPSPSPEWVRRTICCARWEAEHADSARPRVVLATLSQSPPQAGQAQPQQGAGISPVPLPLSAPQNRHEPRASGALVGYWARRARLSVLEVPAGGGGAGAPDSVGGRTVSPEGRWSANHGHGHHRGGRGGGRGGGGGMVERPPAVKAMMDVVSQPSRVVRVLARGEKLDP